jgi:hypothetical protein
VALEMGGGGLVFDGENPRAPTNKYPKQKNVLVLLDVVMA